MKHKKERIYYYTYEYAALAPHFEAMARRGWMLCHMEDRSYYMVLEYEREDPKTVHYDTDFFGDYETFMYGIVSSKAHRYIDFVEAYGYHFLCGCKGILVYRSDGKIEMPLREATLQTQRDLRKATYKSCLFPLLLFVVSCIGSVTSFHFVFKV